MTSVVSIVNSTATPLSGGATFTGQFEQTLPFESVVLSVLTDANGTLLLDQSPNGTNVDSTLSYNISANSNEVHRITMTRAFTRVRLVNGSSAQSFLRLQTLYGDKAQLTAALNATVQQDADAIAVRNVDTETSIAEGKLQGYAVVNKFGRNTDIDTGSVPEDVWGGDGVYTGFPDSTLETISVFSDSASDTAAGTGARTVRVTGLDTDYNQVTADITLNGVTPVATTQTFRRAHTAQVLTAGSGGVNAGTITFRHTTTTTNVFLMMMPGRNQTNNSAYTVPAGKTGYLRQLFANMISSTSAVCEGYIWTRSFGGVFRQRRPFSVSNAALWKDNIYGGIVFTEKSDLIIRINSSTANNTSIAAGYDMIQVDN